VWRSRTESSSRREFLSVFSAVFPGMVLGRRPSAGRGREERIAFSGTGSWPGATVVSQTLLNNRFLTFATVVRVNQIEARRGGGIGQDERAFHTPKTIAAFRDAFAQGWPGGRITWALSWLALTDKSEQYTSIRKLVAEYHSRWGDEVTFIPGGYFANAYNTREEVNRDLHDGIALAAGVVGGGYRPKSVTAGFLAAQNQRFLAENEDIHVCQGNVWSQYSVDNQDGGGSICYP
jgi:Domain of Unknown Function with PDB structure (DUF3863)